MTSTRLALWLRLGALVRPFAPHLAGLLVLSLLAAPLALLVPLGLKVAVDSVVGSEPLPGFLAAVVPFALEQTREGVLVVAAGLFVLVGILTQLQLLVVQLLSAHAGERLVQDFRTRLFRHVQRLSLSYHDARGSSDATFRIQYDAPAVQYIAVEAVIPFLTAMVTLGGMIYVTARIDAQLALVALAVVPVLAYIARSYGRSLREGWRRARDVESSALSVVHEVLGSLRVVKAFGQEDREGERFARRSREGMRARVRLTTSEGRFGLLVGTTTAIGSAGVLYIGTGHVLQGTLTLGELVLVMGYLLQLYDPIETMSKKAADIQGSLVSAERAFALLDQRPDVEERADARPLRRARGAVRFDRVSFAYDPARPVLHGLSAEIPAGTRVGLAGPTGAGKTTVINLLMRFYDPVEGRVLLDDIDLRDLRLADLRDQFAVVLQEPILFSTSIGENIAYARPSASQAELEAAARAANAHDFIAALPEGYETPVGERGLGLSGGERQRISLARAFLKDAPVLVLDEPTSSVDVGTEAVIIEAMERLMSGRTTFMIAHRLSTLEVCDLVLELADGRFAGMRPGGAGGFDRAGAPAAPALTGPGVP